MKIKLLFSLILIMAVVAGAAYVQKKQTLDREPSINFSGFLVRIDGTTLYIDEIQFLSGEEARTFGALDTGCPVGKVEECIPSLYNDFYIRNIDKEEKAYAIAQNASISILSNPGSLELASTTVSEFLNAFSRKDIRQPFAFVRKGDIVIEATEQYTP